MSRKKHSQHTPHDVTTNRFIDALSKDLKPVKPITPCWQLALLWLLIATPVVLIALDYYGIRPDLFDQLGNTLFVAKAFFAIATGLSATVMAFASAVPGFNRRFALVPFAFFGLWFATLCVGLVMEYQRFGEDAFSFYNSLGCVKSMAKYGLPLAVVMYLLLRRHTPLYPGLTASLVALAVFTTCAASWMFHDHVSPSFIQMIWHYGMVITYVVIFYILGRFLLKWRP